jgi:hypothetical protein
MNWGHVEGILKELKDKIVSFWGRPTSDRFVGLIDAKGGQSDGAQAMPFRPNNHEKRSEFSLHIGC